MARSDSPDLQAFLLRLSRHSSLSTDEQQAILGLPARATRLQPNRTYVRTGSETEHAPLIIEGMIGSFELKAKGQRQMSAIFLPGEMANLQSMVQPVATWLLEPLTESLVAEVAHCDLQRLHSLYPRIAEAFWRECSRQQARMSRWVANVAQGAKARLAHLLCEFAVRLGKDGEPVLAFDLPLTQNHLAEATALTAVHANRSLMALRREQVVTMRTRKVEIFDWERLVQIAEFDGLYLQAGRSPR